MYEDLLSRFGGSSLSRDYPLRQKCSFRVGGAADIAAFPESLDELRLMLAYIKGRYRYCVLGAGTNVLCSDDGFRGVVIFTERLNGIRLYGSLVKCECGVRMKDVLRVCKDNSLSGLEFACGIPGSVGGMVAMNAGCFNKCVGDYVSFVVAEDGVYNNLNCSFDYRTSRFCMGETVFEVGFRLKIGEQENIEAKIEKFSSVRRKSQPKGPSCGSCFLNENFFAGKVIDQAGLKGYRIGGARVAEEHANFIVNDGGTATDIYNLIRFVKDKVFETSGIALHEEIKYVGEFK